MPEIDILYVNCNYKIKEKNNPPNIQNTQFTIGKDALKNREYNVTEYESRHFICQG